MWVTTTELPTAASHPFYARVNQLLRDRGFDNFAEARCASFYAAPTGRPELAPGIYFRLLLVGYFEGLDSERAIAWRAADSLTLRDFLGLAFPDAPPDHSTYISEPDRGEQSWIDQEDARDAVYGNRRRIRGERGKPLLRRRGERVERSTTNILKRVLVHASGFNLGLVMRRLLGVGTLRGLQGRLTALITVLVGVCRAIAAVILARSAASRDPDCWLSPKP